MPVSAVAPFPPMPPDPPSGKWTYDDYAAIPDDGERYEVLGGHLIRLHGTSPAPRIRHQELVGALYAALRTHTVTYGGGRAYVAPVDVLLAEDVVVQPDVLFVSDARIAIVGEASCDGAPDLVIEVLAPSTRRFDLKSKRETYASAGVAEYWIVDGEADEIQVLRLREAGTYHRIARLALEDGDTIETPLLPGFSLALAKLFG